jgi:hypothetical protein
LEIGINQIATELKESIAKMKQELKDEIPKEILEFLETKFENIDHKLDALKKQDNKLTERVDYIYDFGDGILIPAKNGGHLNCPYQCKTKKIVAHLDKHVNHLHQENEGLSMVYGDAYLVKLRQFEADIKMLKEKYPMFINPITLIDTLFSITEGDKTNA